MNKILTKIAKIFLKFLPAYPAPDYLPPDQLTEEAAQRQAKLSYEDEKAPNSGFLRFFNGRIKLEGQTILDLGSGFGGRTVVFQQITKAFCIGLEIDARVSSASSRFADSMEVSDIAFLAGVGEMLPFAENSIDMILCYDVFEHVQDPEKTLHEVCRVLKPGGLFLAVFPPYYHPTGSHLNGYVSHLPYANVIFPSKVLLSAIDEIIEDRDSDYHPQPLRAGDKLYGLSGLTIRKFKKMLERSNLEIESLEFLPLLTPELQKYEAWKMRYYAWIFHLLSAAPLLQEFFTYRVVSALRKPLAASNNQ